MTKSKIVVWKDGSHKFIEDGVTWEFENDADWLCTVELNGLIKSLRDAAFVRWTVYGIFIAFIFILIVLAANQLG